MTESKKKIFLVSLGCAKNLVDSENILGLLSSLEYPIVNEITDSNIVIVNTCGFLQSAVEEAIDVILDIIEKKKSGEIERVIVTGCFVQRYGYKLKREMPEVDGWLGTGELQKVTELIESSNEIEAPFYIGRPLFLADHETPRARTTPYYSAYIKIAEGCHHRCSYCTIPAIRGPLRSREIQSIVTEAETMRDQGVREINLIAQDTTNYGIDINDGTSIESLLEKLLLVDGIDWIRILYSHPYEINDSLLELMNSEDVIAPYLDIPFQHINEKILKAMNRELKGETPVELLQRIRSYNRNFSIRTTMMVGFPGETDKAFEELFNFVKETEFDHLGTFIYSPENGTPAARMKDIPDKKVSEERRDAIMKIQADISLKKNSEMIGETVPVLVEGVSPETELLLCGRTIRMAPDVDSQVLINKGEGIPGEIHNVKISEVHPYDIVGEIV